MATQFIDINGRFLCRRPTGVDRFGCEVLEVIDSLLGQSDLSVAGLSFRVLLPPTGEPTRKFSHLPFVRVGQLEGQAWEQWSLPRAVLPGRLLLSLCNAAPLIAPSQVVVIHDAATVAIPQSFSASFRLWYHLLMPLLGRRAREVVTVSEFSRGELTRSFAIADSKITTVSEGGEHILRVQADLSALDKYELRARPYVLAVSSMAAHKNFQLVLDALALLPAAPFDVAIAGGANAKVFGVAASLQSDRVKWLGYVSDEELRALYEGAQSFVFPSMYEGFGIPPLEAMHCGCPVLAARAASIPEVCGDAALYFDPRSASELAAVLMQSATSESLRRRMQERGYAQARKFSWEVGARQLLDVCRKAIGSSQ